ncbi:MAG: hypothetical protein HYR74_09070 [Candidatus Eisenbacteria bacterium]|nr:hypothetical protein [Candidatus Eisenbacteria bacterium]
MRPIAALAIVLALASSLQAAPAPAPVAEISDPNVPDGPLRVRVRGGSVPVEHFAGTRYARIAIDGPTTIEITSPVPIGSAVLLPSRLGLVPVVRGRVLKFSLASVRDVIVQVDNLEPLALFADTVLTLPRAPGAAVHIPRGHGRRARAAARAAMRAAARAVREPGRSVVEFGADPTGRRLATRAFQTAIDSLSGGGDTLRVPAGVFRTGGLSIRRALTLWLAPGARIVGSEDPADYAVPPGAVEPDLRGAFDAATRGTRLSYTQLILIANANGVTIAGRGTIDGSGAALRRLGRHPMLLRVMDSRRVRVEDVILRNPAGWNSHVLRSEDVVFRRVRLLGDPAELNNDGIDPDGSRRVWIDGCFVSTGDDAVAIKSTGHGGAATDVDTVLVHDCVLRTRKSAMKIGTESRCAAMRAITFARNDVIEADRAISLYCRDQARIERIVFEDNRVDGWTPGGTAQVIDAEVRPRDGPPGVIRDVRIRDLWVSQPAPVASSLRGLDAQHPIAGVRFEGVVIAGRPCASAAALPLKTNAFARDVMFAASAPR